MSIRKIKELWEHADIKSPGDLIGLIFGAIVMFPMIIAAWFNNNKK